MQIIFLDIDGVLNSEQSCKYYLRDRQGGEQRGFRPVDRFCPIASSNLKLILEECPDAKMVISSTWRNVAWDEMLDNMQHQGIPTSKVIGKTPKLLKGVRGDEIQKWMDENASYYMVEKIAIIDDDSDMAHLAQYLYQTDNRLGLTIPIARRIVEDFHD